jgi:hypothetical protein
MTSDSRTREYVASQTAAGRTKKEIIRLLKRAIALRFPRDAGRGDSRSDGAHERSSDDACPEEVPAGVA